MIRRGFWFVAGAAAGVSGSLWAQRTARRLTPKAMGNAMVGKARDRASEVASALRAGVTAARQREAELRGSLLERGNRPELRLVAELELTAQGAASMVPSVQPAIGAAGARADLPRRSAVRPSPDHPASVTAPRVRAARVTRLFRH